MLKQAMNQAAKQALLAVLIASAALAQTATKSTTASKSTAASTGAKATSAPKAAAPAAPAADLLHPSTLNKTAPPVYRVKFATTKGDVVIEVTRAWSPRGADRFYNLVRAGYFTDCAFYRVISGFMAQFGISARPEVTKAWAGASILDEPVKASNTRGKLSFANSGPNTRSTAFFINTVDNSRLDPAGFAPIGEVVEGMANVDMLYSGYGATEGHQGEFENGGKAYVDRTFPKLDRILTATIVPLPPAAPAAPKQ
jgi:peptidyl-prolyl cis-trans isomerase A (cyclophilin A)